MRLAPWQRLNVALAHGVLLKASGAMRWTANANVFRIEPRHGTSHSFTDIEADSELDAARAAARMAAQYFYHDIEGTSGFINQIAPQLYRASIGRYHNGVTIGHSVEILVCRS